VREDGLDYITVKQNVQQFVFGLNIASRWGQTPFTNLTFDWTVPEDLKNSPVIIGGQLKEGKYFKDYQNEMDMINRAFLEIMSEGDRDGRIFTFPIPTYNITEDFDWDSENARLLFKVTGKYGLPYFQNFINSDLSPGDVRSMCCRLQMDIRELRNKTGGLFGAGEQTGSIGVVTINLPRLGYIAADEKEFFARLDNLMELAKESLEIKRKIVRRHLEGDLLPYTKTYLGNLKNHFSTIGLVGLNEACLNFKGCSLCDEEGLRFSVKVLDHMRDKISDFQEQTGHIYNLEATPAEGTSFRLAKIDKKLYPNITTAGDSTSYYTNSSQLPVGYTDDLFEALDLQEPLQQRYTGGTVFHGFMGEKISDPSQAAAIVKKVAENYKIPYFTLTPSFSICPVHGYIPGEHTSCPYDVEDAPGSNNDFKVMDA
jgi:ribonucleoside-triphosphate reductase